MADAMFDSVRAYVLKALEPIFGRLDAVEKSLETMPELPPVVTAEEVAPLVMPSLLQEVREALAQIPPPEKGKDGESVSVEDIHPVLMLELGKWALDFERRAQDVLERAIARIPPPKDGLDGLGFDDLSVEYDGERAFTIKFAHGDRVKEFGFVLPLVIDKGYFKEGNDYSRGDSVTFGGSAWIAQVETKSKPEVGNPDWRLAVKKGRDGKDFTK